MTTKNPLPIFVSGSTKQQDWAEALRHKFLDIAIDNVADDDLRMLYYVRVIPTWWIDNRYDLNLKNAPRFIKAAKAAVTKAGSIEAAVDAQLLTLEKKKMKTEAYYSQTSSVDSELLEEIELERGPRPW